MLFSSCKGMRFCSRRIKTRKQTQETTLWLSYIKTGRETKNGTGPALIKLVSSVAITISEKNSSEMMCIWEDLHLHNLVQVTKWLRAVSLVYT
jgi:hypothetical protein